MSAGRTLRDRGVEQVLSASEPWKAAAIRCLRRFAQEGRQFTADDLREAVGDPPRQNAMGAVFNLAAAWGWIRRVGVEESPRPTRHASLVSVWEGVPSAVPPYVPPRRQEGTVEARNPSGEASGPPAAQTAVLARSGRDEEDERRRLVTTPRIDPTTIRWEFGGPLPCPRCRGTGGTLAEACVRCGGTGRRP
jgi:hypothetical protein